MTNARCLGETFPTANPFSPGNAQKSDKKRIGIRICFPLDPRVSRHNGGVKAKRALSRRSWERDNGDSVVGATRKSDEALPGNEGR